MSELRSTPSPDFYLEIEIAVARAELHAFLCDLRNYVPLHPLIESIQDMDPLPEMPDAKRYRVVDRIPFGPLRFRTVYVAALDPVSATEVRGYAWQSPGVRVTTTYALSDLSGDRGTRIDESVVVRAPFGLHGFVVGQARRSHATTLERMKALLEGEPASAR